MSLGEDALRDAGAFLQALLKLLEFLIHNDRERKRFDLECRKAGLSPDSLRGKLSDLISDKIHFGSMPSKKLQQKIKNGGNLEFLTVPNDNYKALKTLAEKIGGFELVEVVNDGKNTTFAFESEHSSSIKSLMSANILNNVRLGKDIIMNDDLTKAAADKYPDSLKDYLIETGIPGQILSDNTVSIPKEYEEKYKKAIEHFTELSKEADSIAVEFSDEKYSGLRAIEIDNDIAIGFENDSKVRFCETDGKLYAVTDDKDKEKALREAAAMSKTDVDISVNVITNEVTMNKAFLENASLSDKENLMMYVPNSGRQMQIKLPREDVGVFGKDGKTYKYTFDPNKSYQIYNADGEEKTALTGNELLKKYNRQPSYYKEFDDNTSQSHIGNDDVSRIEIYDKDKNQYIGIGFPAHAKEVRKILAEHGAGENKINELLSVINDKLPEDYRKDFSYTQRNDINLDKTIDIKAIIRQSELERLMDDSVNIGGKKTIENSCVILDKTNGQYITFDVMSKKEDVREAIEKLNIKESTKAILSHKIEAAYDKLGAKYMSDKAESVEKKTEVISADVPDMGVVKGSETYAIFSDNNYTVINNDTERERIEKCLREKFQIKSEREICSILVGLSAMSLVKLPSEQLETGAEVRQITNFAVQISIGSVSAVFQKSELTKNNIMEKLAVADAAYAVGVAKGANAFVKKHTKQKSMSVLLNTAKAMAEKLNKGGKDIAREERGRER